MPWRGLGKCALGAGLTISALLALKAFAPVADVPRLIACALLGAGLYAGLLRALRPFDAEQRRLLNTIAPPRLAPFIRWTLG